METRNYLPILDPTEYSEEWARPEKGELEPVIGIADIPSMQAQEISKSFRSSNSCNKCEVLW
ncbi:hypothetical protein ACWOFR_08605 [Carnobacterium gallinarum]